MALDKATLNQLRKFATAFREGRDRGLNEADTVLFLVKFFEEVLGYDSLKGEISKEHQIKDRYCDLALKIEGTIYFLVECKAASNKDLRDKDIDQAEGYAAHSGIRWVVLTNGVEWRLFRVNFAENEGISHDLAFAANLLEEIDSDPEGLWDKLSLLSRYAVQKDFLEDYWAQKKALSPASIVRMLFSHDMLARLRRALNRTAPARLELQDVFDSVRDVLSKEALLSAGDISLPKKPKKKKKKPVKAASSPSQADAPALEESSRDSPATVPFPRPDSSPKEGGAVANA